MKFHIPVLGVYFAMLQFSALLMRLMLHVANRATRIRLVDLSGSAPK
jgi:hypothetical protein